MESTLKKLECFIFELSTENSDSLSIDKIREYLQIVKKKKEPADWAKCSFKWIVSRD
jgi:hypothetical protein